MHPDIFHLLDHEGTLKLLLAVEIIRKRQLPDIVKQSRECDVLHCIAFEVKLFRDVPGKTAHVRSVCQLLSQVVVDNSSHEYLCSLCASIEYLIKRCALFQCPAVFLSFKENI